MNKKQKEEWTPLLTKKQMRESKKQKRIIQVNNKQRGEFYTIEI